MNTPSRWMLPFLALCLGVAVGALVTDAHCQEVIMNQPSADIVNKGHIFIRFDEFYTQKPAFFQENLNVAVGVAKNFELSLNNTNAFNRYPVSDSLVPGFKWAPVKTKHFELYVGDQFVQPLTNKAFAHGNVVYEAVAVMTGQWRFTGGSFQSHNGVGLGNRAGAMAGIEYMSKSFKNGWSLGPGIDYATGAGTNGYASPGLSLMKGGFFFCPGYMIGNSRNVNGAHQAFIMTGFTI